MFKNWLDQMARRRQKVLRITIPLFLSLSVFPFVMGIGTAYGQEAKNIILMIADGWGEKKIEAANRYTATTPLYQTDPLWVSYYMSHFPIGGSYDPALAWTDFNYVLLDPITDSAAAASALYSGVKTQNGRISVTDDGLVRLYTIADKARDFGRGLGAVSSVPVSHATPGAWTSHNDDRGNAYAIADEALFEDPSTTGPPIQAGYAGGHGPTIPSVDVLIGDRRSGYVNTAIQMKVDSRGSTS